jgi:hypothetical protein
VPQRKKLTTAKPMVLFAPLPPNSDLPIEVVIEFLNAPDMVVVKYFICFGGML